jgi:WD40 repeat protein
VLCNRATSASQGAALSLDDNRDAATAFKVSGPHIHVILHPLVGLRLQWLDSVQAELDNRTQVLARVAHKNPVEAQQESATLIEKYQHLIQLVQNTTSSSPITERPRENPKLGEDVGNTRAQASEDDNHSLVHSIIQGSARRTLEGHSGRVTAVAFSLDSRLLASGSGDGTVRLWDPVTEAVCRTLEGHFGWVRAVAFSPDGRLLASGSGDKTVRLWDPTTGAVRRTLEGHSDVVSAVAFSPDGRLVASGSADKTVRLWDLATGTVCRTLEGHSDVVLAVAFSSDGRLLASSSADKTVRL